MDIRKMFEKNQMYVVYEQTPRGWKVVGEFAEEAEAMTKLAQGGKGYVVYKGDIIRVKGAH